MNQIPINFGTLMGISVANTLGIDADKNKIDDTDKTATIYFTVIDASTTNKEGKNISVIEIALALATNNASGSCKRDIKGYNTYRTISNVMLNSAKTKPNNPTDTIVGKILITMTIPSFKLT